MQANRVCTAHEGSNVEVEGQRGQQPPGGYGRSFDSPRVEVMKARKPRFASRLTVA